MSGIALNAGILLSLGIMVYYIYVPHRSLKVRCAWKAGSSACFVLLGANVYLYAPSTIVPMMMLGLVLGMLGDILLDLSKCYPKWKQPYFLGGLTSFLLGHIAYMICFINHFQPFIEIPVCIAIAFVTVYILQRLGCRFQQQFIPILIYCCVILLMLYQSIKYVIYMPGIYGICIFVGALLFTISDMILSFLLFQKKDHKPYLTKANLSTYYGAQMILVASMYVYG